MSYRYEGRERGRRRGCHTGMKEGRGEGGEGVIQTTCPQTPPITA